MYRRIVHTTIGALVGYLLGAIVGMMVFATENGFRSVAIVEEPNRNRWAFVGAATAAVLGGLIAWWRSYSSPATPVGETADGAAREPGADGPDASSETSPSMPMSPPATPPLAPTEADADGPPDAPVDRRDGAATGDVTGDLGS